MLSLPRSPQPRNSLTPKTPPQTLPQVLWKSSHFRERRSWLPSVLILNRHLFLYDYTQYFSSSSIGFWGELDSPLLSACIFEIATTVAVFLLAFDLQSINILSLFISNPISLFHPFCCLSGHIMPVCVHSETQGTKEMECVNHSTKENHWIHKGSSPWQDPKMPSLNSEGMKKETKEHRQYQSPSIFGPCAKKVHRKSWDFLNGFFFLFWLMGRGQKDSSRFQKTQM